MNIFGNGMGSNIWRKWQTRAYQCGLTAAPAQLYADLSEINRRKIVERAMAYYNS